jgi:hypothetical protein
MSFSQVHFRKNRRNKITIVDKSKQRRGKNKLKSRLVCKLYKRNGPSSEKRSKDIKLGRITRNSNRAIKMSF